MSFGVEDLEVAEGRVDYVYVSFAIDRDPLGARELSGRFPGLAEVLHQVAVRIEDLDAEVEADTKLTLALA